MSIGVWEWTVGSEEELCDECECKLEGDPCMARGDRLVCMDCGFSILDARAEAMWEMQQEIDYQRGWMFPRMGAEEDRLHIFRVGVYLAEILYELKERAVEHDRSKLEAPEAYIFGEFRPKLKGCTYGSGEYEDFLSEMSPALEHHYAHNRHHPEHFKGGVSKMTLIDLVEMCCDWTAASEQHEDGNIFESIRINADRFNLDSQVVALLANTALLLRHDPWNVSC